MEKLRYLKNSILPWISIWIFGIKPSKLKSDFHFEKEKMKYFNEKNPPSLPTTTTVNFNSNPAESKSDIGKRGSVFFLFMNHFPFR